MNSDFLRISFFHPCCFSIAVIRLIELLSVMNPHIRIKSLFYLFSIKASRWMSAGNGELTRFFHFHDLWWNKMHFASHCMTSLHSLVWSGSRHEGAHGTPVRRPSGAEYNIGARSNHLSIYTRPRFDWRALEPNRALLFSSRRREKQTAARLCIYALAWREETSADRKDIFSKNVVLTTVVCMRITLLHWRLY